MLLAIFICCSYTASAKKFYWIGKTGNWGTASCWSLTPSGVGQTLLPTTADSVYFTQYSFTATGQVVTINVAASCRVMDWTGATFNPTLAGALPLNISGSLRFIPAMTLAYTGSITFSSTLPGQTITTAGKSLTGAITFGTAAGGDWTLMDNFTVNNTINHAFGTLYTNGKNVSCILFNENYANARSLVLGSSIVNITGAGIALNITNGTGFTLSAGNSTINFTNAGASSLAFSTALIFNNIYWTNAASSATINNTGATTVGNFNNVSFAGNGTIAGNNNFNGMLSFAPGKTYTLPSAKTQTFGTAGLLSANGTCSAYIIIKSSIINSAATISKTAGIAIVADKIILTDIAAAGGVGFTATNCFRKGIVTGWNLSPVNNTLYWVGAGINTYWNTPANWSLCSGVAYNPLSYFPESVNNANAVFNASSFTPTNKTVTVNVASTCNDMTWTGATNTPILSGALGLTVKGSLTLIAAMTNSFTGAITFAATTTGQTITTAGKSLSGAITFGTVAGGGWTLMDDLTVYNIINHAFGTLNSNGKNISCTSFNENYTNTRALSLGTSTITITAAGIPLNINATGLTLICGTSLLKFTNPGASILAIANAPASFQLNNLQWTEAASTATINNTHLTSQCIFNNVNFAGNATINGNNTFNGTMSFAVGKTATFQTGKTTTFGANGMLLSSGNCLAPVIIKSSSTIPAIFSKGAPGLTLHYVKLNYITATGGGVFTANYSTQIGCTGWAVNGGTPSVSITAGPMCSGMPVTFTPNPTNGGAAPVYTWYKNNVIAGAGASFTSSTLVNGNTIKCQMVSNAGCVNPVTATSSAVTVTFSSTVTPAASITVNPAGPVCAGSQVTFTATSVNAGNAPVYQWKRNNINAGTNNPVFNTTAIAPGDIVKCILTSNATCANPVTATSNNIILPIPVLGFSISKDTLAVGDSLVVTNTSTGFCAGTKFIWKFSDCRFFDVDSASLICKKVTALSTTTFSGEFVNDGMYDITLAVLDNFGSIDSSFIPHKKTLKTLPQLKHTCAEGTCVDPQPWDPCQYICNGNFEHYSSCPDWYNELCLAEPWAWPNPGVCTSEYFNSCTIGTDPMNYPGVPYNTDGYQPSHNGGRGYAGIGAGYYYSTQREYVQQQMKFSMAQGERYHVEMYLSLAEVCTVGIGDIQMYFTNGQPHTTFYGTPMVPAFPNQLTTPSPIISDKQNWVLYSADFIAPVSNLDWVTIGAFSANPPALYNLPVPNNYMGVDYTPLAYFGAYLYIDDVSVKFSPIINASATQICGGQPVTLTVQGGASYHWNTGQTNQTITVFPTTTSTYTCTVTSASGCTETAGITITASSPLVTITSTNISCANQSNGSASAIATGGNAPYTYHWSNGANTSSISNLPAGTYSVTVTDTNSCSATASVTISAPPPFVVSVTSANVNCNNGANGSASASVNGGISPFFYNWSNGATTQAVSNLPAGNYSVTVTDNAGCTGTAGVIILGCCDQNPYNWPYHPLGTGGEEGSAVTTDANGNVYTGGSFDSDISFGGPMLFTSGNHDAWLAKFDHEGQLLWKQMIGGPDEDFLQKIAVNGNGDIIVTGYYAAANPAGCDFDHNNPGTYVANGSGMYIAKYNGTTGSCTGLFTYPNATGNDLCTDASNNIYVVGTTQNFDVILFGLSSNLNQLWAPAIEPAGEGNGICITKYNGVNHLYITGAKNGWIFVSDYLTNGTHQQSYNTVNAGQARSIVADNTYAYLTGSWGGGVYIRRIFLNSLMPSGLPPTITGSGWGTRIGMNQQGEVYVTGQFYSQNITFPIINNGNTTLVNTHPTPPYKPDTSNNNFTGKFDKMNNWFDWVISAGSNSVSQHQTLDLDVHNMYGAPANCFGYITGVFSGNITFGQTTLVSAGNDAFIARIWDDNSNNIGAFKKRPDNDSTQTVSAASSIKVYPNPAGDLFIVELAFNKEIQADIKLYDVFGNLAVTLDKGTFSNRKIEVSTSNLAEGVYFISIVTPEKKFNQKVIIIK